MAFQCLKTQLYGGDRGLQLVVDVVGELLLDAFFFFLLMKRGGMFAVTFPQCLLQARVEPYDVAGNLSQLIVGK